MTAEYVPRVHWCVGEKMAQNNDYKPLALVNHVNDFDPLAPYEVEQ
jgi:hypothetical protein